MDGKGVAESAALQAAGHFAPTDHPVIGPARMPAPPYDLPDTPVAITASPCLGQHNAEVFAEIGLSADDIARLTEEGALA